MEQNAASYGYRGCIALANYGLLHFAGTRREAPTTFGQDSSMTSRTGERGAWALDPLPTSAFNSYPEFGFLCVWPRIGPFHPGEVCGPARFPNRTKIFQHVPTTTMALGQCSAANRFQPSSKAMVTLGPPFTWLRFDHAECDPFPGGPPLRTEAAGDLFMTRFLQLAPNGKSDAWTKSENRRPRKTGGNDAYRSVLPK